MRNKSKAIRTGSPTRFGEGFGHNQLKGHYATYDDQDNNLVFDQKQEKKATILDQLAFDKKEEYLQDFSSRPDDDSKRGFLSNNVAVVFDDEKPYDNIQKVTNTCPTPHQSNDGEDLPGFGCQRNSNISYLVPHGDQDFNILAPEKNDTGSTMRAGTEINEQDVQAKEIQLVTNEDDQIWQTENDEEEEEEEKKEEQSLEE